jgi:hypothetical protein
LRGKAERTTMKGSGLYQLGLPLLLALMTAMLPAGPAAAQPAAPARDFLKEYEASLTSLPEQRALSARGLVYVPTYASIRGQTAQPGNLAALLRIDNTSSTKPLVLERIDHFDTAGHLIQRFLEKPIALRPFGTIQIFLPHGDARRGPASHFIVTWAGNGPIEEPLIEAVMFGKVDGEGYSFVSAGRAIRTVGKRQWFSIGR